MKYILGDNPFFGVNHRIGSKELIDQDHRFLNASNVILASLRNDFDSLMLSAHEEGLALISKVTDRLVAEKLKLRLSLVVPYPHTINNLVAQHGYIGAATKLTGSTGPRLAFDLSRLLLVGKRMMRKSFITNYILTEKNVFENEFVEVSAVCLHNVFTDLFLGLRRFDLIIEFIECCVAINVNAVVITQNPIAGMSLDTQLPHSLCFSYNSLGYMVNPNLNHVVEAIEENENQPNRKLWAMQILASGNLNIEQALNDPLLQQFDGILYATTRQSRIADFITVAKASRL